MQGGHPKYIVGGRALVFPCVQTIQRLPLNTMTLEVKTSRVYTAQGVPLTVVGKDSLIISCSAGDEKVPPFRRVAGERVISHHVSPKH